MIISNNRDSKENIETIQHKKRRRKKRFKVFSQKKRETFQSRQNGENKSDLVPREREIWVIHIVEKVFSSSSYSIFFWFGTVN